MAGKSESCSDIGISLRGSSPSHILGRTKILRSIVKIHKDQDNLLKRHESWASYLSRRQPNGFVNVPPDVLEQVKEAYIRNKKATESDHSSRPGSRQGDNVDAPQPSGSPSSSPPRHTSNDADNSDEEEGRGKGEGEGEEGDIADDMSWSQSPEHHLRPTKETQGPSQPFLTQLPRISLPGPSIEASPPRKGNPTPVVFPQSSAGPEDDIEVEAPDVLTHSSLSINRSALPMPTPPSAQVVPCTIEESTQGAQSGSNSSSAKTDPQPESRTKKRVYNRVSALYPGPGRGSLLLSHLNINGDRPNSTVLPHQDVNTESSLSTNETSLSIIPSTNMVSAPESGSLTEARRLEFRQGSSSHGTSFGPHNLHTPGPRPSSSIQIQPPPPGTLDSSPAPVTPYQPLLPMAMASRSWEAPFTHYKITYPHYRGSIQNFVIACMCIQLQSRRIRTSLYDDFIRAWVDGYLAYVKECDEAQPPWKALTALDWYNEIDENPLFTSRVVTRQNIQSILDFYQKEVKEARLALTSSTTQAQSDSRRLKTSQLEQGTRETQSMRIPVTPRLPGKGKEKALMQVSVDTPEAAHVLSLTSPIPTRSKPHLAPDEQIQGNRSFGEIEIRQTPHQNITRSVSESIMHKKRPAPNELRSEATKRVSLSRVPHPQDKIGSDAVRMTNHRPERSKSSTQTLTAHVSSSKESSKRAEDPVERRNRQLAKYFKKMNTERRSITPRPPVGNAPTSAQNP